MGDALAVCLLELKDFSDSDFARFHPGGTIGKRFYLKVRDIISHNARANVNPLDSINQVIVEISQKRLGATAVLENNILLGIITDGDLRRMLENNKMIDHLTASSIMSDNPIVINVDALAVEALRIMRLNNINQLIVLDNEEYAGIIHIHDILKEGIQDE